MSNSINRYTDHDSNFQMELMCGQIAEPRYLDEIKDGGVKGEELFRAGVGVTLKHFLIPAQMIAGELDGVSAGMIEDWGYDPNSKLPDSATRVKVMKAIGDILEARLHPSRPTNGGNSGSTPLRKDLH